MTAKSARDEYEKLVYQKLQIHSVLVPLYKTIAETITDENQVQITLILKNSAVSKLFGQYQALAEECLENSDPVMVHLVNRSPVSDFNDISFPEMETGIAEILTFLF